MVAYLLMRGDGGAGARLGAGPRAGRGGGSLRKTKAFFFFFFPPLLSSTLPLAAHIPVRALS